MADYLKSETLQNTNFYSTDMMPQMENSMPGIMWQVPVKTQAHL